jgi:hypothetical protein
MVSIDVGQVISLKVVKQGVGKGRSTRRVIGKATTKTSSFLVVDNGTYKESYNFSDFKCGQAFIIKG